MKHILGNVKFLRVLLTSRLVCRNSRVTAVVCGGFIQWRVMAPSGVRL